MSNIADKAEVNDSGMTIIEKGDVPIMGSYDSHNGEQRKDEGMSTQEMVKNEFPVYLASSVLLEIAKDEYKREKERSDSLDNKAGIYIAAIVAILTVYIQILPFGELLDAFKKSDKFQACLLTAALTVLIIGLVMIATAFFRLTKAITLKDYKRVCLDNLTDKTLLTSPEDQTSEAMVRHFYEIVSHNTRTNDDKVKDLSKGLNKSIIGFMILSIGTVAMVIIHGWII